MDGKKYFIAIAALMAAICARGQVKIVDTFDSDCWDYSGGAAKNSPGAVLTRTVVDEGMLEGEGCFRFVYDFKGNASPGPETVYWQRIFDNFRCDFSFCPTCL